jgi:hypothetical protein
MLIIDRNVFGSGVVIERPSIEFQDGMSFDLETTAKSVEMIYRAQAASAEVRVRMLHPDWNQPQVEEEVGKIMMEAGMAEPDFGGGV